MYRCEARTLEGFIQQIATAYIPHGYWFYVSGWIPERKDPRRVDAKLVSALGVDLSKWARLRRKRAGYANIQYLRHGRHFILLATAGRHQFFEREAANIRDFRKVPLRVGGYSVSARKGPDGGLHAHVRIEQRRFVELRTYLLDNAVRWPVARLAKELYELPFEPYAPVRRQYLGLLRAVNAKRKLAGLSVLPNAVLPLKRRIVRAFDPPAAPAERPRRPAA